MHAVLAAVLAALVAAVAAGCGAEPEGVASTGPVEPAVVASAADATARAGAARMEITVDVQGVTLHGTGVVDAAGQRARLALTVPDAGTFESRFLGGVMYQRVPPGLSRLPDGKHWARFDLARYMREHGLDVSALRPVAGEPWSHVDELTGATRVERLGSERVRGVPTTHYEAEVDLRAVGWRSEAARRTAEELIELGGGRTTYPIEVWLDGEGRLRRKRLTQTLEGDRLTNTIELYGFGADATVVPPPAGDTVDVTDRAP